MKAIEQLQGKQYDGTSTGLHNASMDIFQQLVIDLDLEGRYHFLNAIVNQLRYPNSHTYYFSRVLLMLFLESSQEIIKDDNVQNAFATPGGHIYVFTGLIKFLDNESQLAGVLGHEMAHADRRHTSRQLQNEYGINLLLSVVLGENPNQLAQHQNRA